MGIGGGRRSKEWMEWLSDDPPAAPVARELSARPHQASYEPPRPTANGISVSITVPRFKKPQLPYKKILKWSAVGVGVMAIGVGIGLGPKTLQKYQDKQKGGVLSATSDKPTFDWLLPDGKVSANTGNIGVYDKEKKVVKYSDVVGGVKVTITQQELPTDFKDSPEDSVKKLAESFGATKEITTSTPTSYIGTNAKGPQTVIFQKKGVLVFMLSAAKIDEHDWADYVTRMK